MIASLCRIILFKKLNKTTIMNKIIVLVIALFFLYSCGSKVEMAIDNPSDFPILVKIDSLEVEVPAQEAIWVEMGVGEHTVTLENDSTVTFNFTNNYYMLNPTKSEYLEYKVYYGNGYIPESLNKSTVVYYGLELEGDYKVHKDLILPISWDYGPREILPESVELDEYESYTSLSKILDRGEFLKMMMENMQEETSTEENTESTE